MPEGAAWRNASAYDYMNELDPASIAWEFLRRNPAYRQEYAAALRGGTLDPDAAAALAQRWGLRFRYGPRSCWAYDPRRLDPGRGSGDDHPDTIAGHCTKLAC
jgi:hypothetical protein